MNETFDVVIVGGGAAGCVLAARLSENPDVRVLLLEAGPDYAEIPAELDDGFGHPPTATHNRAFTSEPDPTSGRTLDLPRGRVIGGSSTTNAAFALRGHPASHVVLVHRLEVVEAADGTGGGPGLSSRPPASGRPVHRRRGAPRRARSGGE